ncbi:hypothetical protein EN741_17390, partial [Mesorhizobium sp. M4B.F.Ca.ET.019.03.1.1]
MKVLPVVVAVAAVAGGAQHFRAGSGESIAGETAPSSTYRLTANGDEAACAVRRGAEVSGGLTLLTVGP